MTKLTEYEKGYCIGQVHERLQTVSYLRSVSKKIKQRGLIGEARNVLNLADQIERGDQVPTEEKTG